LGFFPSKKCAGYLRKYGTLTVEQSKQWLSFMILNGSMLRAITCMKGPRKLQKNYKVVGTCRVSIFS
jgi:hypothetical protein